MFKHGIRQIVVVALLCSSLPLYAIRPVYTAQQQQAAKVRKALEELGSGDIRLAVVTRDGRTIAGKLVNTRDGRFGIMDPQQGTITNVGFGDVTGIHANNLSTGASVGIGVGVTAAVLLLLYCGLGERGFCHN